MSKQSMSYDDLGNRMKLYEELAQPTMCMPRLPIMARLDGRAFHTFTQGMDKPYDSGFKICMVYAAQKLVENTGAALAYTQSDEITLVWPGQYDITEFWFGGRTQKMCSLLASMCTLYFNRWVVTWLPEQFHDRNPMFDCRVWQVPNENEAANAIVWRENDAVKNSIMSLAQARAGHKATIGLKRNEQLQLIKDHGDDWARHPTWAKRGTYITRQLVSAPFTAAEIELLPPKHAARTNPNMIVERSRLVERDLPRANSIANLADVIFSGAELQLKTPNKETT